jgi:hypothetical protein
MPHFIAPALKKISLFSSSLALALVCGSCYALDTVSGDVNEVFNNKSDQLTIWNLKSNPNVYVFDIPGLSTQGRTFNRVTHFTEQAIFSSGYPRVYSNTELAEYFDSIKRTQANFAFGHDTLVSELVQFFNLADKDKVELYPEEIVLRDFLLEKGLMRFWRGFYQAQQPGVVLLSIPQLQAKKADEPQVTELARRTVFNHELSHGEYFTNEYYANYCRKFWNESLSDKQRKLFTDFLSSHNYNTNYPDLVVNEMQAYLIYTADQNSFSAAKLGVTDLELESMRKMFRQGNPPTKLLTK